MLTKCVECGGFCFKSSKSPVCVDCLHEVQTFRGFAKLNQGEREALAVAMLNAGAL